MKEKFFDTEIIESYLTGKMSGGEKSLFESAMMQDPLLRSEVALQKDVVSALSDFRKAELKARLNKIDVGAANNSFVNGKIAAGICLLALLGAGTFYVFSSEKEEIQQIAVVEEKADMQKPEPETQGIEEIVIEEPVQSESKKNVVLKQSTTKSYSVKPLDKKEDQEEIEVTPEVVLPRVLPVSNDAGDLSGTVNVPKGDVTSSTSAISSKPAVYCEKGNRKDFHYKYFNNKLYLYGDFNEDLVEFLELNSNKRKNVYLHYNKNYYLLNQNQIERAPLVKINDTEVIKQLEAL